MKRIELSSLTSPELFGAERREIAFSEKFEALASRAQIESCEIRLATCEETISALELARKALPVVDAAIAKAVYHHNPECFRIVERHPFSNSPMIAYLPLNVEGAAALVGNRFDGMSPKLEHICRPGEQPAAIYVWLVFVPGKMTAGLRLLKEVEIVGKGVPIFTRPAHNESARILEMAGFLKASDFFPFAPEWLIVALAKGGGPAKSRHIQPKIAVRPVRSVDDLMKVFSIRTATYISEQACSYDEEFDGNDLCATHLIGELDGEPAGCVRIRYFGTFAKLERLAVRPQFRRSRLMRAVVLAAFEHCRRKGFTKLYAHARSDLVPAWERFGARLMADRTSFRFSDVEFCEMELDLEPHPDAITLGEDPMLLIRPEGEWDRLGPIDRAQLIANPTRRNQVAEIKRLTT